MVELENSWLQIILLMISSKSSSPNLSKAFVIRVKKFCCLWSSSNFKQLICNTIKILTPPTYCALMAAYGAVTSLKNTIQRILQSSRISLVSPSPEILQPVYEEMDRFQKVLRKLDETSYSKSRTKVNALDELIKEAVWEFEDLLDSHLSHHILPQLESSGGIPLSFFVDLQSLQHRVDCFIVMVITMEEEYIEELKNMPEEEGEPISSRIDFGGIKSKMVGLSYEFQHARYYLMKENIKNCYSLFGMAGVGKTTLAKKIFEDPSIRRHFVFRAWVKVGRKCEFNEIIRCILVQVLDYNIYKMHSSSSGLQLLKERLKGKKCLIVLDDVWDKEATEHLKNSLPDKNVRFLLTSRLRISDVSILWNDERVLCLLNLKESKELLRQKVFGEEDFPFQLEKVAEKIAKKCEGLPLLIVTIAELLSKADKTLEYWKQVAKQHSSVFVDAYNQISEVLFPSYDYLPQYLKMFFLYLGAFPPYRKIHQHNLRYQLCADGFLEPNVEETFEEFSNSCLRKLGMWYHLVIDTSKEELWPSVQSCRLHCCWQHLCKEEASKIKFLHVLQSCDDVIKDQRRLCAHYNTLFCFKQVYDSIKSDCASTTRSLLCFGPNHPYPVPIHAMGFKLLRVLDAFAVRFYNFPIEILKLVHLQLIALSCNGKLPTSISNLFHLQFLIIKQYINIKRCGAQSYLPVEIWDMQELLHIEVLGRDLPNPDSDAALKKLITLYGVSANSCTREVFKRIPNIRRLAIEVTLKPYDDDDSNQLNGLSYISELQNLEELSYRVWYPEMKCEFTTASLIPLSMFPSSLKKLLLTGFGYPWKYMNDIGSLLPNLQVLRLQCYAFRGPEWDIESGCFLKLDNLIIEDTDLVQWRPQCGSFPELRYLKMSHCYKLQQLDWPYDGSWIKRMELVECNPLAGACAKRLKDKFVFKFSTYSSF